MNQDEKIKYFLENKKYCYECKYYHSSTFCGYTQSLCKIVGSLDCDQHEYHPDTTADSCLFYHKNKQSFVEEYVDSMIKKNDTRKCVYTSLSLDKPLTYSESVMKEIEVFWEENNKC